MTKMLELVLPPNSSPSIQLYNSFGTPVGSAILGFAISGRPTRYEFNFTGVTNGLYAYDLVDPLGGGALEVTNTKVCTIDDDCTVTEAESYPTGDIPLSNGGIQYNFYGSLPRALEYFSNRLHTDPWDDATIDQKHKSLIAATRIIDTLNYKGDVSVPNQYNAFPRGTDTAVPADIEQACYEIAFSLLDGRDPDMELESLGISSQGIESVRTTYARNQVPIEHLINGVPSSLAWRLLRPYLRDDDSIKLVRV